MRRLAFALALVAVPAATKAEPIVGLTVQNAIVRFDTNTPGTVSAAVPITGTSGVQILGIDYRPANGLLYGIGSNSGIYVINPTTGAATQVSAFSTPLAGTAFGVDFNPVPDLLRTVSTSSQNLRTNVNSGAATSDGALNGATTRAVGAAYTNNFAGATSTQLFVIDSVADALYLQNPPNAGVTVLRGPLGFDTNDNVGFDISPSGAAFASLNGVTGGPTGLFSINLNTGAATLIGSVGGGVALRDIALPTANAAVPEPLTLATFAGLAAAAGLARRRRK